jgi:hypothetical protein
MRREGPWGLSIADHAIARLLERIGFQACRSSGGDDRVARRVAVASSAAFSVWWRHQQASGSTRGAVAQARPARCLRDRENRGMGIINCQSSKNFAFSSVISLINS